MRIIELPLALSPDGNLALAALIPRDNGLNTGWEIYLDASYDLYGGTPVASYDSLAGHNRFAQQGELLADYAANTRTIDLDVGLRVQLVGPDLILDTQTPPKALADELLLFVDDEIMSVVSGTLTGAGAYTIYGARGRMGSVKAEHLAGAEVWIVPQADILPLQNPSFFPGHTLSFKVIKQFGRGSQELAAVDAVSHTIANRILTEAGISNLRFNGSAKYLHYAGGDIVVDWTTQDPGASLARPDLATVTTLVEFLTAVSGCIYSGGLGGYYVHGSYAVAGDTLAVIEADLTTMVGANDFYLSVRRQVATPDFTALSEPQTLFVTQ